TPPLQGLALSSPPFPDTISAGCPARPGSRMAHHEKHGFVTIALLLTAAFAPACTSESDAPGDGGDTSVPPDASADGGDLDASIDGGEVSPALDASTDGGDVSPTLDASIDGGGPHDAGPPPVTYGTTYY